MMEPPNFSERTDKEQVELGLDFAPRFDENGLIPCITVEDESGDVLMFAWMNQEALQRTLETGKAVYFSRRRKKLWIKGETSGRIQLVQQISVDCDQDTLLLRVLMKKEGACHRGYRTCFYRKLKTGSTSELEYTEPDRMFDPEDVY